MLIIFDWDGTLLDSADKIISCMQAAALDVELSARDSAAIRDIIGLELGLAIGRLYPELNAAGVAAVREAYSRRFAAADVEPCSFFAGAQEGLSQLATAGHTLCIATGKSRRGLDRVLAKLPASRLFAASRCADETASKPDPLMLRELCDTFATPPNAALMVGDTEFDLEMASHLGMPRVGVSYGAHPVERLRRWQPLAILDDLRHLPALVSDLALDPVPRRVS